MNLNIHLNIQTHLLITNISIWLKITSFRIFLIKLQQKSLFHKLFRITLVFVSFSSVTFQKTKVLKINIHRVKTTSDYLFLILKICGYFLSEIGYTYIQKNKKNIYNCKTNKFFTSLKIKNIDIFIYYKTH